MSLLDYLPEDFIVDSLEFHGAVLHLNTETADDLCWGGRELIRSHVAASVAPKMLCCSAKRSLAEQDPMVVAPQYIELPIPQGTAEDLVLLVGMSILVNVFEVDLVPIGPPRSAVLFLGRAMRGQPQVQVQRDDGRGYSAVARGTWLNISHLLRSIGIWLVFLDGLCGCGRVFSLAACG